MELKDFDELVLTSRAWASGWYKSKYVWECRDCGGGLVQAGQPFYLVDASSTRGTRLYCLKHAPVPYPGEDSTVLSERFGVWCDTGDSRSGWVHGGGPGMERHSTGTREEMEKLAEAMACSSAKYHVRPYPGGAPPVWGQPTCPDCKEAKCRCNEPIDTRPIIGSEELPRLLFESDDAIRALAVPDVKDEKGNPYRVDVVGRAWEMDHGGLRSKYEELVRRVVEKASKP